MRSCALILCYRYNKISICGARMSNKRTLLILQLANRNVNTSNSTENINPASKSVQDEPQSVSKGENRESEGRNSEITSIQVPNSERDELDNLYSDNSDIDADYVPSEESSESENENVTSNFHKRAVNQDEHVNILETPTTSRETNDVNSNTVVKQHSERKRRRCIRKEKRGRKRMRNEEDWLDVQAKRNRNLGREYKSRTGKIIEARKMKGPCKETCRYKCREKVRLEVRETIFKEFWAMGDHTRQWDFITKFVKQRDKKQIIAGNHSKRQYSREYHLPGGNTEMRVCKTMFLNTIGVSETYVTTALKQISEAGCVEHDMGGRHKNRPHRISENIRKTVVEHIKRFPVMPSHYIRKDSQKMYLEEGLNISQMHRLYVECMQQNGIIEIATKRQYADILNADFNIGFFKPKKDQCDLCSIYNIADEETKASMHEKYDKHLKNKTEARKLKDADKDLAVNDKSVCAAVFDLQKVLGTPRSEVSVFYYKSKFATYNFTVYDMGNNEGYCYVWHEQVAKRGSNELSSCLLNFVRAQTNKGIKKIIFYSDCCGGQNRNRFISSMFNYASSFFKIDIIHRFLESGHTQNEGDSMHAVIEHAKTRQSVIYTPDQWITLIRMAKTTGKPYIVREMCQNDFVSFKNIVKKQNWKVDDNKQPFKISKIKEMVFLATSPNQVSFKYNYEDNKAHLTIKKQRGRNSSTTQHQPLPKLYTALLPTDARKLAGLLELCKKGFIPTIYHNFYESLIPSNPTDMDSNNEDSSDCED